MNIIEHSFYLFIPIILSTTIHMFAVKNDWLSFLKVPINEKLFGANKTIRGFVIVVPLTAILQYTYSLFVPWSTEVPAFYLGALIGFTYMICELPNSWLKRKVGIPPGGHATKYKFIFILLDRLDSSLGVIITYSIIASLSIIQAVILQLAGMLIHLSLTFLLFKLKIRKNL